MRTSFIYYYFHNSISLGLLMAEERLCEIQNFVLRFQRQLATIQDGFTVHHNDDEYDFTVDFVDRYFAGFHILCHWIHLHCTTYIHTYTFRNDKKVSAALLGVTDGCLSCEVLNWYHSHVQLTTICLLDTQIWLDKSRPYCWRWRRFPNRQVWGWLNIKKNIKYFFKYKYTLCHILLKIRWTPAGTVANTAQESKWICETHWERFLAEAWHRAQMCHY